MGTDLDGRNFPAPGLIPHFTPHMHTHTHTHTHTFTHIHTRTFTSTRTPTHACTHTLKHTHTQTHTKIPLRCSSERPLKHTPSSAAGPIVRVPPILTTATGTAVVTAHTYVSLCSCEAEQKGMQSLSTHARCVVVHSSYTTPYV